LKWRTFILRLLSSLLSAICLWAVSLRRRRGGAWKISLECIERGGEGAGVGGGGGGGGVYPTNGKYP